MEGEITLAIIGGLIFLFSLGFSIWTRAEADETRLEMVRKEIDAHAVSTAQNAQVQTLVKEFKIESNLIEALNSRHPNLGETTIVLAMAQRLVQTSPEVYPVLGEALIKIESLRKKKMNWSKVAKNLGFKVGPALNVLEHTRNELRRESYTVQPQTFARAETTSV